MMTTTQTNSLTIYQDGLLILRRESTSDGAETRYHLEHLSCDDPVMVASRETFVTQSQALTALLARVELDEEEDSSE